MIDCTVLHCTALYYTVLHCTVLHCTALYCTVLYCTVLHCTALYCTALCLQLGQEIAPSAFCCLALFPVGPLDTTTLDRLMTAPQRCMSVLCGHDRVRRAVCLTDGCLKQFQYKLVSRIKAYM